MLHLITDKIIDLNGEEESEDALLWHLALSPGITAELTHTFHYQGSAGQTIQYPEPQLTMTNLDATESVTFTGETEFLPILPPLTGVGIPPAKVIQGTTVHIPVTVTNRLQTQTASGTVRLQLIDFIDQTQPYEDTSEVMLVAGEDQNLTFTLDTANIAEGTYLLMSVVESNEGEEEIFAEYVEVRKAEIFLPLILRTP